ncbi:MAG: hypothetical protein CVU22_07215 [Betaproteobacteria bacterium HGW-Betaproteobacteria-16]|nr:MAG: hypothetical protein CVU22_07215 [Betaproteobacteria bacterium HGW-Betaproteobacteria-16]
MNAITTIKPETSLSRAVPQPNGSYIKSIRGKRQLGMSLPLMAFFITVSTIFVIVAIIYGPRYFDQSKASNEVTTLSDLKANVVAYGSRVGAFTAANSALPVLVGQGIFPRSNVGGTAASPVVLNQWGAQVTVAVGTVATAGDSLVFANPGIPEGACAIIATSLDDVALRVDVGATTTKAPGARSDPAAVNTACAAGGANNTLTITMGR